MNLKFFKTLRLPLLATVLLLTGFTTKKNTMSSKPPKPNQPHTTLAKADKKKAKKELETTPDKETAKTYENQEEEIFKWIKTWSEVMTIAQEKAFRTVNFSGFMQEALKAAVSRTDAHSSFFSQASYKTTSEQISGKFSGIGISIQASKTPEDEALVIVDVIEEGPAQKVGIRAGDKIVEVNREKLKGLSSDEIISKIKGKAGTTVNLKIIRNKNPLEFKVKRAIVKDASASCFYFKDQNVYYLALKLFTEPAAKEMRNLLEKANHHECKGIILDLRHNSGGILESAVEMASLFIPKGSLVVSTKDKNHRTIKSYATTTDPILKSKVPIFIIINNFTASASEILAGCLKHYASLEDKPKKETPLVFLVGTPTFGKGSVQEVIPISNGCALKLTTMLYYLPDNSSIQACGIQPDFLIKPKKIPTKELKWIDELYGRETAMKYHITKEEVENPHTLVDETGKAISNKKKEEEKKVEDERKDLYGNNDEDENNDESSTNDKTNKTPAEKQKTAIGQDITIQACINMVGMLDLASKNSPELLSARSKAQAFLKRNYLTDDPVLVEKID